MNNSLKAIVVGSGPAGVAASWALLDAGCRVTMVDAGLRLENGFTEKLAALQRIDPAEWNRSADLKKIGMLCGRRQLSPGPLDWPYSAVLTVHAYVVDFVCTVARLI